MQQWAQYLHNVLHNEIEKKMQMNAVWVKLPSIRKVQNCEDKCIKCFSKPQEISKFRESNCPL